MSLSLKKLDQLIDALIINAGSLIEEAHILNDAGFYARSYALAHFSREESAKSYMLQAAAFKIQIGKEIDWKQLMRRFRAHNDKLRMDTVNNALLLLDNEAGNINTESIINNVGSISKHRNIQKNTALYVDINEGVISEPASLFNQEKSERTIYLAKMSYEQQRDHKKNIGNYSDQKKIKIDLPDFESMEPEELLKLLKNLAPFAKSMFTTSTDK